MFDLRTLDNGPWITCLPLHGDLQNPFETILKSVCFFKLCILKFKLVEFSRSLSLESISEFTAESFEKPREVSGKPRKAIN